MVDSSVTMGINTNEFESFEQQILELIEELQTITSSESHLRDALRAESTRAEAAEAARDAAQHAAAEARSTGAAASASAAHAAAALAKVQGELTATTMQFELAERHRAVLEEKCSETSVEIESLKRDLEKLRPLQAAYVSLQRQYTELQDRIQGAVRESRRETSRLETELRRVEKCASGGAEIRDRARLAAAAHVRERRLAAEELQHTSHELHNAKSEVTKLGALVAELQCQLSDYGSVTSKTRSVVDSNEEALAESQAALEAERAGSARLERALAAALSDNATLAACMHASDNSTTPVQPCSPRPESSKCNNICPIDSFLAE